MSHDTDEHAHTCDHCDDDTSKTPSMFSSAGALRVFTPLSGVLLGLGFVGGFLSFDERIVAVLYLLSIAAGSVFVLQSAVRGLLRQRFLNISFLVVVASVGAIAIGEYGEAAAVVFLFSLGEFFESFGVERSRRAVEALLKKAPKVAQLKGGQTVPVESVAIGDVAVVRPGESIPLDGVVIMGESSVDEAAVTGESVPADKRADSQVFAGTLNIQGYLEVRVTKMSKDSTFSRIIALIEEAQSSRAPSQAFIDRFARYYTPLIVVVSALVALVPTLLLGQPFEPWLYRAITLLVIACPCALVIATPVAIASAIGGASRHGILVKGGKYLERLASIKAIAFDKTRTLTHGRHTVTDVITFGSNTREDVLADASGIEAFSSHPLAEAITRYAAQEGIKAHGMGSYSNVAGKGGSAMCNVCSMSTYIGNRKMLDANGIASERAAADIERFEKEGKTVVLVAHQGEMTGLLAISDEIRSEAPAAVAELKQQGIASAMLTGDNEHSAKYVAAHANIAEVHASLLPDEKVAEVKKLKERFGMVAMVGDGVNDAPSLVTSDVGFAIGAGGTDAAIESSDVTLLSGDLALVPRAIRIGRATMATIRINIALALGIKIIFLALIPFGLSNLVLAIAADSGMAIVVILNSLRLFNIR